MSTQPTDAELDSIDMDAKAIANQNPIGTPFAWRKAYLTALARAVLAKWGQPAHSGEPVATVQTIHGVTIGYLEAAVPAGAKLYTAPQPVEREPLTNAQREKIIEAVDWYNFPQDVIDAVERAHGIKGGQHGVDRL